MTLNPYMEIPYEIGTFIASLIPNLDENHEKEGPWAMHRDHFEAGPIPCALKLIQGILLECSAITKAPLALYTPYGKWTVLGSNSGDFENIFETIQQTLNLKKFETIPDCSLWEIHTWDNQILEDPIIDF